MNALLNGEIDMVEIVPPDLLPLLQQDKNIKVMVVNKAGRQYELRFNVLHKPFDNPKIREAVLYALDQKPFLEANVGNADFYTLCKSVFPCGSPLSTTKGWDDKLSGNVAKARELLKEAGYDGTPVVLMHQTDIAGHNQLATVAKPQLEAAGFKVDLQAMDWQTLVARRARKDPLASGGWSAFFTSWGSPDVMNPVSAAFINASCDKATFGWPCDAEIEKLRDAFAKETDPGKRKSIAEQVLAASVGRLPDLRATRPVHRADGDPQQHHRTARRARARTLERGEEMTDRAGGDSTFAGSIPALYDRFLGPLLFAPYAREVGERLADLHAGALLETAAGTGIVTVAWSRRCRRPSRSFRYRPSTRPWLIMPPAKPALARATFARPMRWPCPSRRRASTRSFASSARCSSPTVSPVIARLAACGSPADASWSRCGIRSTTIPRRAASSTRWRSIPADPPRFLARTPHGHYNRDTIRRELAEAELRDGRARHRVPAEPRGNLRDPAIGFCQGTPMRGDRGFRRPARPGCSTRPEAAATALAGEFGRGPIEASMQALMVVATG